MNLTNSHSRCPVLANLAKICLVAAVYFVSVPPCRANGSESGIWSTNQHTPEHTATIEESIWLDDIEALRMRESEASRIVQIDSHSIYGHYLLAQIYLRRFKHSPSQLKNLQQASDLGQHIIELDPTSDLGYLVAAQVLDLMGHTESALNALKGDPKHQIKPTWRVAFLKANLMSGEGVTADALALFSESLREPGALSNIIVPYLIATIQSSHEDRIATVNDLKSWKQTVNHRLFDLALAIALTDQKAYSEAHQIYSQLQSKYSQFDEAFINDAILLSTHLNRPNEAIRLLTNVLSPNRKMSREKENIAKAHLARIFIENGHSLEAAKILLSDVIRNSPSPNEWIVFSQKAFIKSAKVAEFVASLDEVRKIVPGTGFTYALQGEILSENLDMHDRALELFHSAIILEPNRSDFYNGLGLTYYRMKNMQKALVIFTEATKIDPKDATSRYNEACVLAILGRSNEAIGALKTAINLDPRLISSAKSDADLKSLWNTPDFLNLVLPKTTENFLP